MRISDWSSDVCSSDLPPVQRRHRPVREIADQRKLQEIDVEVQDVELVRTAPHLLQHPHMVRDVVPHGRSEERRVGKECFSTCRSRWSPSHYKQTQTIYHIAKNQHKHCSIKSYQQL